MKSHTTLIAASMLALAMNSAFAAAKVELNVAGAITPATCRVNLPNGDTASFGSINLGTLNPTQSTPIGSGKLSLRIACDSATSVVLKTFNHSDASKPTEPRPFTFAGGEVVLSENSYSGLGFAAGSDSTPIGAYAVKIGAPIVDGIENPNLVMSADGEFWSYAGDSTNYFNVVSPYISAASRLHPVDSATLSKASTFVFPFEVAGNITMTSALPNEEIEFSGSTAIEVSYL